MHIAVNGLNARYRRPKRALYQNLTVDFPDGKVTGLFGPNGVGKSTLLRLLAHLEDGIISNALVAAKWATPNAYVAYVPQGYTASLMPWFPVDENISLPLIATPASSRVQAAAECAALKDHFKISYPPELTSALSGGQQQTIVLLRALIRKPELLLLDEPFSALDVYTGALFRENYFRYLRDHDITTIFVTHDLRECIRFSDRILFLKRDKAQQKDDPGLASAELVEFPSDHRQSVASQVYLDGLEESLEPRFKVGSRQR